MKATYFKTARKVMLESDFSGRAKMGCAVVYKGAVIATASNSDKTCPIQRKYNDYRFEDCGTPAKTHAEIGALKKIRWLDIDFGKVYIYIYRENKLGRRAMARPCASCMAYIKAMGIRHVCYTTEDGYAEEKLLGE